MSPPIPYAPETPHDLRARYPRAIEHVFDQHAIVLGAIRPGECAGNVFDFHDGLRFIISRERGIYDGLHVSASVRSEGSLYRKMKRLRDVKGVKGDALIQEIAEAITPRFRELSGDSRELRFIGHTGAVLHWIIDEDVGSN